MKTKNYKILTNTEKTIAVIEEYEKFTERLEAKYGVTIKYNIDKIKSNDKKSMQRLQKRF